MTNALPRPSTQTPATPVLGIVLLDGPHYSPAFGRFSPSDRNGLGSLPVGFFESPMTWPVATAYAVAEGATTGATRDTEPSAIRGLEEAVRRLAPVADVIISDCGFFYGGLAEAEIDRVVPTIVSGLELIVVAGAFTRGPIGVLTANGARVKEMLASHRLAERIRIAGVEDMPSWAALGDTNFAESAWTTTSLRDELLHTVRIELETGSFRGIRSLVIECTVMPQFRAELVDLVRMPVLDVARAATCLL